MKKYLKIIGVWILAIPTSFFIAKTETIVWLIVAFLIVSYVFFTSPTFEPKRLKTIISSENSIPWRKFIWYFFLVRWVLVNFWGDGWYVPSDWKTLSEIRREQEFEERRKEIVEKGREEKSQNSDMKFICTQSTKELLKSPRSADFDSYTKRWFSRDEDARYAQGWYYAENSFWVELRWRTTCKFSVWWDSLLDINME